MPLHKLEKPNGGENKVKCICGHSVTFNTNYQRTCSWCGRLVYPNKKMEFKEKLKKEMRKNK